MRSPSVRDLAKFFLPDFSQTSRKLANLLRAQLAQPWKVLLHALVFKGWQEKLRKNGPSLQQIRGAPEARRRNRKRIRRAESTQSSKERPRLWLPIHLDTLQTEPDAASMQLVISTTALSAYFVHSFCLMPCLPTKCLDPCLSKVFDPDC